MGAGNPLVRSYDDDRIAIQTFFHEGNIQSADDYIAENAAENDGEIISEDSAYERMADENYESFTSIFYVGGLIVDGFDGDRISELSAEFRGDGIIFARGDYINVVVPSGCEHFHIGFGFVPNRSWESFWEEMHDENAHKRRWYESRGLDFDIHMEDLAQNAYESYIKKCNSEIKKIAAEIAKQFGKKYFEETFRNRTGPWTTGSLTKKEFRLLALI